MMVRQAAFNSLEPELWNIITVDDHIVDFQDAAKALCFSLEGQLTAYKADVLSGRPEDADWHKRTSALYDRITRLLRALGPKVKARNIRHYDQARPSPLQDAPHSQHRPPEDNPR